MKMLRTKYLFELLGFILSHHAIINEYTGQLFSNGAMSHRRGHHAIHPSTQTTDHLISTNLFSNMVD